MKYTTVVKAWSGRRKTNIRW